MCQQNNRVKKQDVQEMGIQQRRQEKGILPGRGISLVKKPKNNNKDNRIDRLIRLKISELEWIGLFKFL